MSGPYKPGNGIAANGAKQSNILPAGTITEEMEPGSFPIHALNPVMRAMVESVADVLRVPVQLPALCAVGILSGALGNAFTVTNAVNGKKLSYGNLFVIIAAAKSSGKGSVADLLVTPLLEASAELESDFKRNKLPRLKIEKAILEKRITNLVNELTSGKTGDGRNKQPMGEAEKIEARRELEQAQARLDMIEPFLDALPTYWLGNITSEAMEMQFKMNNLGLFCYSPEAGATVRVMLGKYTKGDAADFDLHLSGYSVEPYRSDRIGRGTCQITPCLAELLLLQPPIVRELMENEEAFERGMTARTVAAIVETEPLEDDGVFRQIDAGVEAAWNQLIRDIIARRETLAGKSHCIACTPEAREIFRQFHNEAVQLRRGEFQDIEAELGRWRENAIRLSVGQCVADNREASELTGEQAARAVEIMRWCARSSLQIANSARLQKRAKRADVLQALLAGKPGGRETLRNLDKSHGITPEEVRKLAGQFPERFTVERVETRGRPSEIIRLATLAP